MAKAELPPEHQSGCHDQNQSSDRNPLHSYYSKAGAANGNWTWEGKNYTGYDNYRKKTGLDTDSPPFSDPRFISTGNPPDLDIQPTSPAVNAGTNLGENVVGTVDFAGNPRVQNGLINIGAYEQ